MKISEAREQIDVLKNFIDEFEELTEMRDLSNMRLKRLGLILHELEPGDHIVDIKIDEKYTIPVTSSEVMTLVINARNKELERLQGLDVKISEMVNLENVNRY